MQLDIQKIPYLENVALEFGLLVLKLYPIQVVVSLSVWKKLTMGQLLLLFLSNFCSFFSYIGDVLVTSHSSLLLIDIFWLFRKVQHIRSICDNLFDLQRSSELPHFLLFWCIHCMATPRISSSNKNINNTARVSRLSF